MDKYQLNLLSKIVDAYAPSVQDEKAIATVSINEKGIEIKQNENYHLTSYTIKIRASAVKNVKFTVGKEEVKAKNDDYYFYIPIDFNDKTLKVYIEFADELVDSGEFKLFYTEADKSVYDAKHAEELKKIYTENAQVVCHIDFSVLTVAFKPCCEAYSYSVVKWCYNGAVVEEVTLKDKLYSSIMSSISFVAQVYQYDSKGNLLVCIEVAPKIIQHNFGGR